MIKFLHTLILLAFFAPAYAWECADDTRTAFTKAKAAYVIRIESKTKLESSTKLDEQKFLEKNKKGSNLCLTLLKFPLYSLNPSL